MRGIYDSGLHDEKEGDEMRQRIDKDRQMVGVMMIDVTDIVSGIMQLRGLGVSKTAIAKHLKMTRQLMRQWQIAGIGEERRAEEVRKELAKYMVAVRTVGD